MILGRVLVLVGAAFFTLYGLMFLVVPELVSEFVTGGAPPTASGVIDMRATYGGMSIAFGLCLLILALNAGTLHLSVIGLLVMMICMAAGRTVGMTIDGSPNMLMFVYLGLELLTVALCLMWLKFDAD